MHYTNLCSLFAQEPPSDNELKNLAKLLYNGFYCFEALTERNLDDVICGICGVAGHEVYLGDGNEKNCCSISEVVFFFVLFCFCFVLFLSTILLACTDESF